MGSFRQRTQFYIQQTELVLQDLEINLDQITELNAANLFRFEKIGRGESFNNDEMLVEGIMINMSKDLIIVERSVYL